MSDSYSTQTEPSAAAPQGITVNVAAPQPAAATIPSASEADIDRFLGSPTPATPAGGRPDTYQQDPHGGGFISGFEKGVGQQVLGALSLLPGVGNYFTRESWLGQRAYAPSRGGTESLGIGAGTVLPWLAGGAALGSARGVAALTRLSPSLSRVLAGAERLAPSTPIATELGEGAIATEAPTVGGGIARLRPTVARGTAVGAAAGAVQEPAGNTGYSGRVAPAVAGALGGAALTKLGLTGSQQAGIKNLVTGLSGLVGADIGGLGMAIISMFGMHNLGVSAVAAHHLAPLITAEAQRLASQTAVAPAGAAIGKTVNEIGERLPQGAGR